MMVASAETTNTRSCHRCVKLMSSEPKIDVSKDRCFLGKFILMRSRFDVKYNPQISANARIRISEFKGLVALRNTFKTSNKNPRTDEEMRTPTKIKDTHCAYQEKSTRTLSAVAMRVRTNVIVSVFGSRSKMILTVDISIL